MIIIGQGITWLEGRLVNLRGVGIWQYIDKFLLAVTDNLIWVELSIASHNIIIEFQIYVSD